MKTKLIKVKVLKSSTGRYVLRAGQIRELPEDIVKDLVRAGHVKRLSAETRESKKAAGREKATAIK